MPKEDEEGLRREADIAVAVRGPDYLLIENSIAKNKSKGREHFNLQREIDAKLRFPVNSEGESENVSRYSAITKEHESRKRYAVSQRRQIGLES